MKAHLLPLLLTLATATGFAACGGSNDTTPATAADAAAGDDAATGDDAGGDDMVDADVPDTAPPPDHGAPSTTYPAFPPDTPQLKNNGGSVMTAPKIVAITWDTDPAQAQLDSFNTNIGASPYWSTIVSEYGVGAATATNVHIAVDATHPVPSGFSNQDIGGFVDQSVGTGGWPAPDANTIYILYIHPSTTFTYNGNSGCSSVGGYHSSTQSSVAYAVVLRCGFNAAEQLSETTVSASHELGETVTDPGGHLESYYGFDVKHGAWDLFQIANGSGQLENGDACEFYSDQKYTSVAPFAFDVQRMWSNKAAAAGHPPCAPDTRPYFTTVVLAPETVTVDLSEAFMSPIAKANGFNIPVGTSKTFQIGFNSDAATTGPWSIAVAEALNPEVPATTHNLTVSVDKKTGLNGEKAYVTVKVNKAGSTIGGYTFGKANYVTVLSSLGGVTHYTPILITN